MMDKGGLTDVPEKKAADVLASDATEVVKGKTAAVISTLEAELRDARESAPRLRRQVSELAADRDRWKSRAERAEKVSDPKSVERLTKERDALKAEVAALKQKEKPYQQSIAFSMDKAAENLSRAQRAERKAELLEATCLAMQSARDAAQKERDQAAEGHGRVVSRVAELEAELLSLRAPRPAPPKAGGDLPEEHPPSGT